MTSNVEKSENFDENLDVARMVSDISKNVFKVGNLARTSSNKIAPLDTGKLRNSATVIKAPLSFKIVWTVVYARVRYRKNFKNPESTRWAKKDFKKNKDLYLKIINEGVIK